MNRQSGKRPKLTATLLLLAASIALAACGSDDSASTAADAPDYASAVKSAPPKLADYYANGSELITGGEDAYDSTLASLRGYPVVVNHWGSWCVPCREEIPYFQQESAKHLDEVAFLGVDAEDSPDAYATFLRDTPIPYPSVEDPDGEFSSWADTALVGQPNTLYYDADGELVYTHQGPYTDEAALDADIQKYALSS